MKEDGWMINILRSNLLNWKVGDIFSCVWLFVQVRILLPLCSLLQPLAYYIITARKRSLRRLCFYRCLSVHGGGRAWLLPGGVWLLPGGHVWLLGGRVWLLLGGVHGCSGGDCVVAPGEHAWLLQGGIRGCCWGGMHEIRRYGQWAGGTHPTGMHSCLDELPFNMFGEVFYWVYRT